jgi:V/A-type H+-transporting ATPase subunit E
MDTEQVVEKILSEAQAEADKIKSEARDKAAAQEAELAAKLKNFRKETKTLAQKAAQEKTRRMLAAARMDTRKELLSCKVALLNEVFDKAREKIKELPEKQYHEFVESLMHKAIESGDEEVVIGAEDSRFSNGLIKSINRKLGPGFKGNLQLANDTADIDGGFILRRGNIQVNVSVGVLLAEAKEQMEIELAAELFGGEQDTPSKDEE